MASMVHGVINPLLRKPIESHDLLPVNVFAIRGSKNVNKAGLVNVAINELEGDHEIPHQSRELVRCVRVK